MKDSVVNKNTDKWVLLSQDYFYTTSTLYLKRLH